MQDTIEPNTGQSVQHLPGPPTAPGQSPATQIGLLMVRNNDQIEEASRLARSEEEKKLAPPQADAFASYVLACWEEARTNKERNIEPKLIDSWRRRKGEYSPEKLAAIEASGQTPVFMKLTEVKCNAFEAWFSDIVTATADRLWALSPTPVPDLPQEVGQQVIDMVMSHVMQKVAATGQEIPAQEVYALAQSMGDSVLREYKKMAIDKCHRMEDAIEDILEEGEWDESNSEALEHLATFGTCIVKGPIVRQEQRLAWQEGIAFVRPDYVTKYMAVHPLNCYPSPSALKPSDGYMIEFVEMRRSDVRALRDHPGYNKAEIDLLLEEQSRTGLRKYRDLDISKLNLSDNSEAYHLVHSDLMQGLEFYGPVSGQVLKDWGVKGVEDVTMDYDVECIIFGSHVIRAVVNDSPLGLRKYSKACFKPRSGSFWGQSPAELMSDVQDVCNGAARALVNNMGIASGPMVVIDDISRIPEGVDLTSLHPWQILQFNGDRTTNKKAVDFFTPDSNAGELMAIYERFMREADDRTGIPAYSYGNDRVAGAGKTARGLGMLMANAARGIKKAIADWDQGIIQPCLERLYHHLMLYHPDASIKGDAQVVAKGALGIFAREQLQTDLQALLAETNNPADFDIMGQIGRADLLRRRFRLIDRDLPHLIPSNEELIQRAELVAEQQALQTQQAQAQGQAEQQADRQNKLAVADRKNRQ